MTPAILLVRSGCTRHHRLGEDHSQMDASGLGEQSPFPPTSQVRPSRASAPRDDIVDEAQLVHRRRGQHERIEVG